MYRLPSLSYELEALAPIIGVETMRTHHGKHHARYVEVTNEIAGATQRPLEEVILDARRRGDSKLFNNAAQAWNHAFFWESMAPAPASPTAELTRAIDGAFGGRASLRQEFVAKGAGQFGSGWVWLVATGRGLEVVTSHDADQPWLGTLDVPLLVCDVWEHAYYLDYKNERARFLEAWFDRLANWAFAATQLTDNPKRYRYPAP